MSRLRRLPPPFLRRLLAALALALVLTACTAPDPVDLSTLRNGAPAPTSGVAGGQLLDETDLAGPVRRTAGNAAIGLPAGLGISCVNKARLVAPATNHAEVTFEQEGGGLPAIYNSVESFDDPRSAAAVMEELRRQVADCHPRSESRLGLSYELDVSGDDVKVSPHVDDQVNVTATGTLELSGVSTDFNVWMSIAAVGRQITTVGIADLDDDSGLQLPAYTARAVAKLGR